MGIRTINGKNDPVKPDKMATTNSTTSAAFCWPFHARKINTNHGIAMIPRIPKNQLKSRGMCRKNPDIVAEIAHAVDAQAMIGKHFWMNANENPT